MRMRKQAKTKLAKSLKTQPHRLDRLLDPDNEPLMLGTLIRAARRWDGICAWSWCRAQ